ncbi:hypothetical protein MRX96_015760 [Rhipicephalus microplus]
MRLRRIRAAPHARLVRRWPAGRKTFRVGPNGPEAISRDSSSEGPSGRVSSNRQSFGPPTRFATALSPIKEVHVKKSTSMLWVTTQNCAALSTPGRQQFVTKDSASSAVATSTLGQTVQLEHRRALTVA